MLNQFSLPRITIAVLCGLLVSFISFDFIKHHAFSNVDIIEIEYETNADTLIRVFFGQGEQANPTYTENNSLASPAYAGAKRRITLHTKNKSLSNGMIQIGSPVEIILNRITLHNSISNSRNTLDSNQLGQIIKTADTGVVLVVENDGLAIKTITNNTNLMFNYRFVGENNLLIYGISILIGLLTLLFCMRFDPQSIPAISDLSSKSSGISGYRLELDGLRGIAALLVLLEHTWWRFAGSGATGVWIFFGLSGYLLTQPFISSPARAMDPGYVTGYIFRRLARILPMYFITLLLIYGVTENSNLLLSHMLFLQAEGHLWTIPQEVFFYLILPVLMITIYFLIKLPRTVFLFILAVIVGVFLWDPKIIGVELYGYSRYRAPYLGWFMIGMLVAYAKPGSSEWQDRLTDSWRQGLSLLGIILTLAMLVASSSWLTNMFTGTDIIAPSEYRALFAVAGALLMFLILICPDTLLSRIFSFTPLRAIGIVGYSYYLLHPMIIQAVMDFSLRYYNYELLHGKLFLITSVVTWLVCLFSYSIIERPFLLKKHQS